MNKKIIIYTIIGVLGVSSVIVAILLNDKLGLTSESSKTSISEKNQKSETSSANEGIESSSNSKNNTNDSDKSAENGSQSLDTENSKTIDEEYSEEISVSKAKDILEDKFGKGYDETTGNKIGYVYIRKIFNKKDNKSYYYFINNWQTEVGNTSFLQTIFISTDGTTICTSSEPNIENKISKKDILDIESLQDFEIKK